MITACHSCRLNGKGDNRCITCKRVSQDDIRISKTPHAREEMIRAERKAANDECVTTLGEDDENKLRIAMATIFGLSPIQLLCLQHLMNGGRLATFGESLRKTNEHIGKYRGSERAQAGMMKEAIAKRAPMLAPVLTALVRGGMNTGGLIGAGVARGLKRGGDTPRPSYRSAKEMLDDSMSTIPLGNLFEFFGVDQK